MVEKIIMGMLLLILVYLLVANPTGSNAVIAGLSQFNTNAITALQGRGIGL